MLSLLVLATLSNALRRLPYWLGVIAVLGIFAMAEILLTLCEPERGAVYRSPRNLRELFPNAGDLKISSWPIARGTLLGFVIGVLPGTGGLTRVTDKRGVRKDRADVFATKSEGFGGQKAVDWKLVDEAVRRAVRAQADPAWSQALPHERATVLYRIADGILDNLERIAGVQTRDTGKTLTETRALARSAAGTFRYMAAALETLDEDLTTPRGHYLTMSVHQPLGVVGAITPWNSPVASDAQKLAPALAAGNAVVLKPATWAPLTSLELARICQLAGLPDGLLSVVPGDGSDAGDRLVRHPDVKKVSFTGGTSTGLRVAAAAAEKLMPVALELGGKSPTIVFDEVDAGIGGATALEVGRKLAELAPDPELQKGTTPLVKLIEPRASMS